MASIRIVESDRAWPREFEKQAVRIRKALGERVLLLEHVGSTSVPGLAAKPVVDILLVVANSADEDAYRPALEHAGFALTIREPGWHEHRMLKGTAPDTNLHVFSAGCAEAGRMIAFRDRLRTCNEDRDLYAQTKRDLAMREWKQVQDYADAKTVVVEAILARSGWC